MNAGLANALPALVVLPARYATQSPFKDGDGDADAEGRSVGDVGCDPGSDGAAVACAAPEAAWVGWPNGFGR
ncbi:MAG: hypothetical protein NVS3B1_16460 [Marmoricola sp.]